MNTITTHSDCETPIDGDWLISIGFGRSSPAETATYSIRYADSELIDIYLSVRGGWCVDSWQYLPLLRTRRDVRLLCELLKIKLHED